MLLHIQWGSEIQPLEIRTYRRSGWGSKNRTCPDFKWCSLAQTILNIQIKKYLYIQWSRLITNRKPDIYHLQFDLPNNWLTNSLISDRHCIQNLHIFVQISNSFRQNGSHWSKLQIVRLLDFRSHSKFRPFTNQPVLVHTNPDWVRSPLYLIIKLGAIISNCILDTRTSYHKFWIQGLAY